MEKKMISAAAAVLLGCALAAQTSAEQAKTVPVMLYPDTDHGTCSIGLRVNAGGAALRSGPGEDFAIIAMLKPGHVVSGCDEQDGWDGIIDGQHGICSIGISVPSERPYTGPCDSGWIDQAFLTSIYG
jgi:hypothetical protein